MHALTAMLLADHEEEKREQQDKRAKRKGSIYFIQSGSDGPIKIGYTANPPEKRRAELQIGSSTALTLLGAIPARRPDERQLHLELADHRLDGEWFAPAPRVLALIAETLAGASRTFHSFGGGPDV